MAEFVCIMKQRGEGCDYTIGCGTVAYSFEADDYDDAFSKVKHEQGWDEFESDDYDATETEDRYRGEYSLERLVIYQVSGFVNHAYERYFENLICQKRGLDEVNEKEVRRKQYEALQKEFGSE